MAAVCAPGPEPMTGIVNSVRNGSIGYFHGHLLTTLECTILELGRSGVEILEKTEVEGGGLLVNSSCCGSS